MGRDLVDGLPAPIRQTPPQRDTKMAFNTIPGGFELSADDIEIVNQQRAITKTINDQFIQVGAVFLKTSNKSPIDDDWAKTNYRDTNLQTWIDDESLRYYNAGFNLQAGWVDIDIDAADGLDPEFNRAVIRALEHLRVDTRFQFGRASVGAPTHVLVQLGEDESQNWEELVKFEPKMFILDGRRYHVQLRSMPTHIKEANLVKAAKQSVMPGSIYTHKTKPNQYDLSVWWADGKVARTARVVAATTPRRANFNELVRAISFAVFARTLRDHWVEGNRQTVAQKVCGWLARVVAESAAMNNHEALSKDVFCPIDSEDMAERLIAFVCDLYNDDEKHMRIRAFHDAVAKLERNPDARIPGWPAMDQMLGGEAVVALRTVLSPGSDVSHLSKMAERYVYDESDGLYIDRSRFFTSSNYIHEATDLERRHKGDTVRIGGKPREAFKVFESSDMRKRIGMRDFYPDLNPGQIYRMSPIGEIMSDEDEGENVLPVFNTWRGWPIGPVAVVDADLMNDIVSKLDRVLGYLTQDNEKQINWIKDWLAWTFQNPGKKQQIGWVVIGEQGIGKSWIGNVFMKALMGYLWGSASPKILEGSFVIGPFKDKMFVFVDEAKFTAEASVDEVKKLIRGTDIAGTEKYMESRNYNIYSRVMFASNRIDIGVGQSNVIDRALFFTKAYDKEFMSLTQPQFRAWAEGLKPFFSEFTKQIESRNVREHFIRYFMDRSVNIYEIESIKYSSSDDHNLIMANMSWPRRIAKYIIEEARIMEDFDICVPFTISDVNKRVAELSMEMGMRGVQGSRVLREFQDAGLIETIVLGGQKKMRFTHKAGELTDLFGDAISTKLEPRFVYTEKDYGRNDCDGSKLPGWRGTKKGVIEGKI